MALKTENYTWECNSLKMYEYMISSVPPIVQITLKIKIEKWLDSRDIKIITEEIIFQAEDELAPAALKTKFAETLESMKTS
ncbi:MAG: hypothetical protein JEZ04_01085 [Spirochaetales bacterium]|nr:hypothetical protein [Spirochaetales bacterium]